MPPLAPEPAPRPTVRVSAVMLRDPTGRVLMVRKRGTARFMLPGGKPEPGETAEETAVRECEEELGVRLDPTALIALGTHRADAANEEGWEVEAAVFAHPTVDVGAPAAEIEELRWIDPSVSPLPSDVAPLTEEILPLLADRGSGISSAGR